MADWPPTLAGNFGFPGFRYTIKHEGPETLVTRFDDGTELRREVNSTILRRFIENWEVNRADMATMLAFYKLKGMATIFEKLALDPTSGAIFSTDVVTVRFDKPPTINQVGPSWYKVKLEFIEVSV